MNKKSIIVMGAGAIGSNLTALLATDLRGEFNITVLDKDKIEKRNIQAGTQFYMEEQIGLSKVESLQYNIHKWYGREIKTINHEIKTAWDLGPVLGGPSITLANGRIIGTNSHPTPDLVVDSFDNHQARFLIQESCLPFEIPLLHLGFSDNMTFAIEWAENYIVPDNEMKIDVCTMSGASSFVKLIASLGSLTIQEFINNGKKREFIGNSFNIREVI